MKFDGANHFKGFVGNGCNGTDKRPNKLPQSNWN